MLHSVGLRVIVLLIGSITAAGACWWYAGPIPQDTLYHCFADQRLLLGVPHALNVLSNMPFIIVGVLGMAFLLYRGSCGPDLSIIEVERYPYWFFFIGLVLTGIGSSYYHANPNNDTLVWDRAALAMTFMALFTSILAERVHVACARWALLPLVFLGVGSVFYWNYTEHLGHGDLRSYLIVQFLPLAVVPLLLFFYPPRYTHGANLWASLLCYLLAKALELLDSQVYTGTGFVSGHTLKHLIAALGGGFILLMLWQREPRLATSATQAPP